MRITELKLLHFRNYEQQALCPHPRMTVLTGQNAQGKTNVLEALHLCCLGRSHRTAHDRELIRWGSPQARVQVKVLQRDGTHEVDITLSTEDKRRKVVRVGGTQVGRIGELMGHLSGVFFAPEDLAIVKEGPAARRRFLDMELSQLRPAYFYALQRYVRALNQRNALLKDMQKKPGLRATLASWDEQLALAGADIVFYRRGHVQKLSEAASVHHRQIAGPQEVLGIDYATQIKSEGGLTEVAQRYLQMLGAAREEDIRRAVTSVGPHRDDILLKLGGREARIYASQGQQRTIVLSMKLAELTVAAKEREDAPVLLLDDVMSELDPRRRQQLIEHIGEVQTIVTCTHLSDLGGAAYGAAYQVEAGQLKKM